MGCYSFANHVLAHHPGSSVRVRDSKTWSSALRREFPDAALYLRARRATWRATTAPGSTTPRSPPRAPTWPSWSSAIEPGSSAGAPSARATTSTTRTAGCAARPRRGCRRDGNPGRASSSSPGAPTRSTGRSMARRLPPRVVQAFFPGEEGGPALAGILSGRRQRRQATCPCRSPGRPARSPTRYLHPLLGGPSEVTSADSTPLLAFGHGLTYTTFERTDLSADDEVAAGGEFTATVRVRNTGARAGTRPRPAVRARRLRQRHPTGGPAARLRAGDARARSRRRSSVSTCPRPVSPSPGDRAIGSSSPATSSCGSVRHAPNARRRRRCASPDRCHRVRAEDARLVTTGLSSPVGT